MEKIKIIFINEEEENETHFRHKDPLKFMAFTNDEYIENSIVRINGCDKPFILTHVKEMKGGFKYNIIGRSITEYWNLEGDYFAFDPNITNKPKVDEEGYSSLWIEDRETFYPYSPDVLELSEYWLVQYILENGEGSSQATLFNSKMEAETEAREELARTRFDSAESHIVGYALGSYVGYSPRVKKGIKNALKAGARNFNLSKLFELERSKDISSINKRFNKLNYDQKRSTISEDQYDGGRDDKIDTGPSIWE